MTFDEFRETCFEICESIQPGCYAHACIGRYKSEDMDSWNIATDIWPHSHDCDVWHYEADTPEKVIAVLRKKAESYGPSWRRQVAEAMGVL